MGRPVVDDLLRRDGADAGERVELLGRRHAQLDRARPAHRARARPGRPRPRAGASRGTSTCSPSATGAARFSAAGSALRVAPPARATASATRDPGGKPVQPRPPDGADHVDDEPGRLRRRAARAPAAPPLSAEPTIGGATGAAAVPARTRNRAPSRSTATSTRPPRITRRRESTIGCMSHDRGNDPSRVCVTQTCERKWNFRAPWKRCTLLAALAILAQRPPRHRHEGPDDARSAARASPARAPAQVTLLFQRAGRTYRARSAANGALPRSSSPPATTPCDRRADRDHAEHPPACASTSAARTSTGSTSRSTPASASPTLEDAVGPRLRRLHPGRARAARDPRPGRALHHRHERRGRPPQRPALGRGRPPRLARPRRRRGARPLGADRLLGDRVLHASSTSAPRTSSTSGSESSSRRTSPPSSTPARPAAAAASSPRASSSTC